MSPRTEAVPGRRTRFILGACFILLLACPAGFVANMAYWTFSAEEHLTPPPTVTTLRDFVAWRGPEAKFSALETEPRVIQAEILYHMSARVASGPACYVFDQNGRLIDWTDDRGDDGRFQYRWPVTGKHISKAEALSRTNSGPK